MEWAHPRFMPFLYAVRMHKQKETMVAWLSDALDLEHTAIRLFDEHARKAEQWDPELTARLSVHLEKGKDHARRNGDVIARLGGTPSRTDVLASAVKGMLMNIVEAAPKDEEVRRLIDEWTVAQSLVLRYAAVLAAARAAEDMETAMAVEGILEEKRSMTTWFEEYLPMAVREFMTRES